MDSEELLAQLADIHLPEPVSFWPPAIGWWILAALALVLLIILFRKFASYRRQQKICQYAIAELERCYDSYSNADPADIDQSRLRLRQSIQYHRTPRGTGALPAGKCGESGWRCLG